ncbi:MAG: glycoside hydrolase family 2 protein, partial [Lachnospiraceae bacterium]
MRAGWNDGWMFSSDQGKTWKEVTLPHDAQMTLLRRPDAAGKSATGFFPGGDFLYKKEFILTAAEAEGHIEFAFGGVYKNPEILLNGVDVRERGQKIPAYGYLPFRVSGDGLLKEGKNTIEVFCSNKEQPDTRWYSGAGIFRPVWMDLCGKAYLVPGSVRVRTSRIESGAKLEIQAKTVPARLEKELCIRILSPEGEPVAERVGTGTITVQDAALWSAQSPMLYTAEFFGEDGEALARVRFGIRKIQWDSKGLYVNGKPVLLRGGCIHADNGVIGARETLESERRRIRILKENGFNAIRCAHNPASEELLQ